MDEFARLASRPSVVEDSTQALDLTQREREVLELIAAGKSDKEIAVQLSISLHTVKTHVRSILSKLHAVNRWDAVRLAAKLGWSKGERG
jgi:ATP/maltotriose-dependent transcriptional regulator MalT